MKYNKVVIISCHLKETNQLQLSLINQKHWEQSINISWMSTQISRVDVYSVGFSIIINIIDITIITLWIKNAHEINEYS